jgi:DNA (cytosine-5)-methyltransferase 1
MGFTDKDFKKVKDSGISDTQLYKQAGNSIVVDVLVGIFKELLCESNEDTI